MARKRRPLRIEAEKATALNPYNAGMLGGLSLYVAFTGHWDEGTALAEKAMKLAGPTAAPFWWWPAAKRAWFRGEYQEAYDDFQRAYIESFWLSHLDLAYNPAVPRAHRRSQAACRDLKMYPTMTVREADAFYKLVLRLRLSREDGRCPPQGGAAGGVKKPEGAEAGAGAMLVACRLAGLCALKGALCETCPANRGRSFCTRLAWKSSILAP